MRAVLMPLIISVLWIAVLGDGLCNPVAISQEVPHAAAPKVVFIADKEAALNIEDFDESYRLFNEEIQRRSDLREQGITRVQIEHSDWAWGLLGLGTGNELASRKLLYRIEPLSDRPVEFSRVERPDLIQDDECFIFHMGRMTYRTRRDYQGKTVKGGREDYKTTFDARQSYSVYWRESRKDVPILLIQSHFDFGGTDATVTDVAQSEAAGMFPGERRVTIKKRIVKSTSSIDELVRRYCRSSMLCVSSDPRQELNPSSWPRTRGPESIELGFRRQFLEVVSKDLAYAFLVGTKRRPRLRLELRDGKKHAIAELQNPLPRGIQLQFGIEEAITEKLEIGSHETISSTYRSVELGPNGRKSHAMELNDPRSRGDVEHPISAERRVRGAYLIWNSDPHAARRRLQGY